MTIQVGVVGAGIMGRRMIQRMTDHGAFRVTCVWDPAAQAVADALDLAPGAAAAGSVADLVRRDDVDVVYIASPPRFHMAQAGAAFDAGKKVLCEKPLAVDLGEAAAMTDRVAADGLSAAVNYPLATAPAFRHLAQAVTDWGGCDYTKARLTVAFRTWPRPWQARAAAWLDGREEGGFTREVASHFLFALGRLFGPLQLLTGSAEFPEPDRSERSMSAILTAGRVPVTVVGRVGETKADDSNELLVNGKGGALRLTNWYELERRGDTGWAPMPEAKDRQPPGFAQLDGIAAWATGQPHPLASFAEALAVQRVVEGVLAGA